MGKKILVIVYLDCILPKTCNALLSTRNFVRLRLETQLNSAAQTQPRPFYHFTKFGGVATT